ncbi:basic leucine-zipper 70-related [Anaeramoeba flamelloides]|uniref:Basic leucine-zipper 70-related n=1 Tax=Anaeramoeba flamelloides TaxID=1746091 RepID=A0AAV7ZV51_9EUKA|nr:basic leucine-zipper 70-related [Anaeramoeba flamelloides]
MNNLLTDQINLFSASTIEENLFQLPVLDLDFDLDSSIFNEFEELPSQQELTKSLEITDEQPNENGFHTIDNFSPKSPNETELVFSPNSFPYPFETDEFFTEHPFEITENDGNIKTNDRKREHSQVEQKIAHTTNIPTLKTEITKIDNRNLNNSITYNSNNNKTLFLGEEELAGTLTRSQIKLLTEEQKKKRKVLKNRISASKCYTKMKQKIVTLDKTVENLKKSKGELSDKIINAKNERVILLAKQSRLEKEIKKLLQTGQEISERKNQVIGSLRDNLYHFGTIPSQENETTEPLTLPETIIEDVKWKNFKRKLVNNSNNRTGFAMMVVIIAITIVFGNEMIFNKSSTTQTIPLFSNEVESKRGLQTLNFGKYSPKKDKYLGNQNIWIEEIDDTELDEHTEDQIETIPNYFTLSNSDPELAHNGLQDKHQNPDKKIAPF